MDEEPEPQTHAEKHKEGSDVMTQSTETAPNAVNPTHHGQSKTGIILTEGPLAAALPVPATDKMQADDKGETRSAEDMNEDSGKMDTEPNNIQIDGFQKQDDANKMQMGETKEKHLEKIQNDVNRPTKTSVTKGQSQKPPTQADANANETKNDDSDTDKAAGSSSNSKSDKESVDDNMDVDDTDSSSEGSHSDAGRVADEKDEKQSSAATEGKGITLRSMDVVLGRPTSQHKKQKGNYVFWDFVLTQLPAFSKMVGNFHAQMELAQKVIDYVEKEKGGRFLFMDGESFTIAPKEETLAKVRRGIKEKWERDFHKVKKTGRKTEVSMLGRGGTNKPVRDRAAKNAPSKTDNESVSQGSADGDPPGVNPMDVLVGNPNRSRKGNQLYWNYLMKLLPRFGDVVDNRGAQFKLAQEAIDYVEQDIGGRFLLSGGNDGWHVGDRGVVLARVRRAMKEKWERMTKKGQAPKPTPKKSKKGQSKDQEIAVNRPRRSKDPSTKKRSLPSADYTMQLTQDIVELLKAEQKALSMKTISRRVDAEMEDADGVCKSLAALAMVHMVKDEETRKGEKSIVTKYVWWEYAPSYLKQQSWEEMPMSEDAEHAMRSEMSLLVREEAKLDAWISRLRNLRVLPQERIGQHLFVTAADIYHAMLTDPPGSNKTSSPAVPKKKKAKKVPALAVHAPFGTTLQSSTPVSYQRDKSARIRQVLISCNNPPGGQGNNHSGQSQDNRNKVKVFLLPKSVEGRTQLIQNNSVLQWIKEPSYTSEANGLGGAGDNLHVSCLQDDEGVSSFF
jgi:hypothetical protein